MAYHHVMRASILVILLTSCAPQVVHEVTPQPLVNNAQACGEACDHLRGLGCDVEPRTTGLACNSDWECNPNEDCIDRLCTTTCESYCIDVATVDPVCARAAATCEEALTCQK